MSAPKSNSRANRHRGEIEGLVGERRLIFCLTLGALAELETAFAVDDLGALAARFSSGRLAANDIIRILGAGLRGGGNDIADDDVAISAFEDGLTGAIRLVAQLLAVTFGSAPSGPSEAGATPRP